MNDAVIKNQLYELSLRHIIAKAVSLASQLQLDKVIGEQALPVADVAATLNISADACWRFLRLLDAYDVVALEGDRVKAAKMTPFLQFITSPHIWNSYDCFSEIEHSLKNNDQCYSKAFSEPFYSHIAGVPGQMEIFSKWCADSLQVWMQSVFQLYDFTQFKHIVDVGGGEGYFISNILSKKDTITGTLFDQAPMIAQAKKIIQSFAVEQRINLVVGDFFQSIPQGGDAYIICRTLLNWSNEDAIKILNNCRAVMDTDSKLIIVDFYVPEKSHPHYQRSLLSDFNLFAFFNSSNRTIIHWQDLLAQANLTVKTICTSDENTAPEPILPICIIETMI